MNTISSNAIDIRELLTPEGITTLEEEPIRYQSKYLQLSFKPSLMHQELISFLTPKGLCSIAAFQSDVELRVFLSFDKPKDFFICKKTSLIIKPRYFEDFFGGALVRGYSSFDNDLKDFNIILEKSNVFTRLIGDDVSFMYNLDIKDINYFENVFSKNYLDNLNVFVLDKYKEQLIEYGSRLEADVKCFNDLVIRINAKVKTSALNEISLSPTSNSIVTLEPSLIVEEKSIISKDSNIEKTFDIEKPKFFQYLDDDVVNKDILQYILSIPYDTAKVLTEAYLKENNINVSRSKKDLFRIVAMYYGLKTMPKTSDPNTWLKNFKNALPTPLYDYYKKFL